MPLGLRLHVLHVVVVVVVPVAGRISLLQGGPPHVYYEEFVIFPGAVP